MNLKVGDEKYALGQEEFEKLMKQSDVAVHIVANWFIKRGFKVEIPKLKIAPSWKERLKYSDNGDLFFYKNGKKYRIEVKYRPTMDFKNINDIPYDDIIVNAINSWDKADPKPVFHLILNKSKTHILIINSNTKKYWYKNRVYDKRKKGKRTFYFCPKMYIKCSEIRKTETWF